jgi:hypothetical protein
MEKTYKWIHDEMASGRDSVVNALPRAVRQELTPDAAYRLIAA